MKLVIEIPEEYRSNFEDNRCKEKFDSLASNEFGYVLRKAFENGKPLPKGHWIMTGVYYTGAYETIDYVECSCCHEESLEEGNYCPNCGAKMIEE